MHVATSVVICTCKHLFILTLLIGTETVAFLDSTRTEVPSIYNVNCEILIELTSKTATCLACKSYRKSLAAVASRCHKDDHSHPSSHITYFNLHTPEKIEHLCRLHKECKNKKAIGFVSTAWFCLNHHNIPIQENSSDCGVFIVTFTAV